jgi:FkbM family methyltransferase
MRSGNLIAKRGGDLDRWAALANGARVHLSLDEPVYRHIYFFGEYEARLVRLLGRVAQPGEVWADIGANIGVITATLSQLVGAQGRVLAVEPNPRMVRHLKITLGQPQFSNVRLFECALGACEGAGELHIPTALEEADGGSGRGSLLPQSDIPKEARVTVPVRRLDDLVAGDGVGLAGIKIDVEGYEAAVLEGAAELLRERPPAAIFAEVSHRPDVLLKPEDLIARFMSLSYVPFRSDPFVRYEPGEPLDANRDSNMIFLHSKSVGSLTKRLSGA